AIGAEHAVVAGDQRNRLHAEGDLVIEGGGPAQLRQVISQRGRRAVVAETEVSDAEIADKRRAEGIGIADHGRVVVKCLRTPVDAGLGLVWVDRQVEVVPISVTDKYTLLVREAVIDSPVVLVIIPADAGVAGEVVDIRE